MFSDLVCLKSLPEIADLIIKKGGVAFDGQEGARVVRGRDWEYGNQDGGPGGIGTITHPLLNSTKWNVIVNWDHDNETGSHYRMGMFDKYDLTLAECIR